QVRDDGPVAEIRNRGDDDAPRREPRTHTGEGARGVHEVLEDVAEEDRVELPGELLGDIFQGDRQDAVANEAGLRRVRRVGLDADDPGNPGFAQYARRLSAGAADVQGRLRAGRHPGDEVRPRLSVHLAVAVEVGAGLDPDGLAAPGGLARKILERRVPRKVREDGAPGREDRRVRAARGPRLAGKGGDVADGLLQKRRGVV